MAINKTLTFEPRDKKHRDGCSICGRTKLGKKAVCANYIQSDPPDFASPYCFTCIEKLFKCMRGIE